MRYSEALPRRRVRPCSPGGYGRLSSALVSPAVPQMLVLSRRDTRARGPVYRAMSDPPPLGGTAAVVRHRRDVLDARDLDAGVLDRADRGLTTGPRALHHDVDLAHAVLH